MGRNEAAAIAAGRRSTKRAALAFEIAGVRFGATMSTAEAADLFGCSSERLQSERGKGTLPVEPLALGRRLRWPTVLVAEALGLEVAQVLEAGSAGKAVA